MLLRRIGSNILIGNMDLENAKMLFQELKKRLPNAFLCETEK